MIDDDGDETTPLTKYHAMSSMKCVSSTDNDWLDGRSLGSSIEVRVKQVAGEMRECCI